MVKLALFLLLLCSVLCNCNEDSYNVIQMIEARNYPTEQHYATTQDGFILSIQRITGPRYSSGISNTIKPAVMLLHGLEDNSISWVIQEVVDESLGFILADAGFDVWLPNVRGNTYSTNNTHLSPKESTFWNWSFDEMASFDLPTIIDYILTTTGADKIAHVGHSQGTIMGFMAYENSIIAEKINIFVALAPIAWVEHCSSDLLQALAEFDTASILALLGDKDFLPDTRVLKILLPFICYESPSVCENFLGLIMGWDTADFNNTRLPVITAHEPSGTSTVNMIHWSQMVRNENFQAYDYGKKGNMQHYNTPTPPQYYPQNITIPVALFHGGHDDMADPTDVAHLMSVLKSVVFINYQANYSHLDFIWGVDAKDKIYPDVVRLLQEYATN